MNVPLAKLDPGDAWKPAPAAGWDLKWAAHLYRRGAFGAPPRDPSSKESSWKLLDAAVRKGRDACIDGLLSGAGGQESFDRLLDAMGARIARGSATAGLSKLQGWWLYRMLYTPHPLRERLTLFWHNHFATSVAKVGNLRLMLVQNQLLRKHALRSFRPMLGEIGRDPAMIVWLDSTSNVRGRPNENYAREVMELFSLGVGNYTEQDIREAARALTGWGIDGEKTAFRPADHDEGVKTILGQQGKFGAGDVVRILLEQKAAARFLAGKLYREFISETEPAPAALLEPLAETLRSSDYRIDEAVRMILRSRLFNSAHAYRQRIKSPVDYVVGLLRSFDASVSVDQLAESMKDLGQSLFAPPNVKGWDGGRAWLNSATLLARHNLAWKLVGGETSGSKTDVDVPARVAASGAKDATGQLTFLLDLLLQGDVDPAVRKKLEAFLALGTSKKEKPLAPYRVRELAHTILLIPNYQLS